MEEKVILSNGKEYKKPTQRKSQNFAEFQVDFIKQFSAFDVMASLKKALENKQSHFYSKSSKLQIRCFGIANINHRNKKSESSWKKMGDISKECYFQDPLPGTPINNYDNFAKKIEIEESDFFCVVEIKLSKIDWLFLKREGHRRANIFFDDKKKDLWVSP